METTKKCSHVTAVPPGDSSLALARFEDAFRFETDCWDVHQSIVDETVDFVLLDVRGPDHYRKGHIAGSINVPHGKIVAGYMAKWPADTVFVVLCAGPHCNGAHRAAVRLATLGRPVKMMIGGITGWLDEGFPLVRDNV